MPLSNVTLCTCTYNDGLLVRDLLFHIDAWEYQPARVIVIDDGSKVPFEPPKYLSYEPKCVRLEKNVGVAQAKNEAIKHVTTPNVLLMDCDIRFDALWLATHLHVLEQKTVGIIGAPFMHKHSKTVLDRFLFAFDNGEQAVGKVDFLPGPTWLMRTDTWRSLGGLADYKARTHEDHYFCQKVLDAGLTLWRLGKPAFQVRRNDRLSMAKRFAAWFSESYAEQIKAPDNFEGLYYLWNTGMQERLEYALQHKEFLFVYFEALIFAALAMQVSHYVFIQNDIMPEDSLYKKNKDCIVHSLSKLFRSAPRLSKRFKEDMLALGLVASTAAENPLCDNNGEPSPWEGIVTTFEVLEKHGLVAAMEKMFPLLLEEDKDSDFSFYSQP